jgi:hypothetical protein
MARPRKYASDADRQAAYRDRYALVEIRLPHHTLETLNKAAELYGVSRNEMIYNLIAFALANRDWMGGGGLYAKLRGSRHRNPESGATFTIQTKAGGAGDWVTVGQGGLTDQAKAMRAAQAMARRRPFDAFRVVSQ